MTVVLHPLADYRRQLPIERLGITLNAASELGLAVSYNPGCQSVLKDLKDSMLARAEARISLTRILDRMSDITICQEAHGSPAATSTNRPGRCGALPNCISSSRRPKVSQATTWQRDW